MLKLKKLYEGLVNCVIVQIIEAVDGVENVWLGKFAKIHKKHYHVG